MARRKLVMRLRRVGQPLLQCGFSAAGVPPPSAAAAQVERPTAFTQQQARQGCRAECTRVAMLPLKAQASTPARQYTPLTNESAQRTGPKRPPDTAVGPPSAALHEDVCINTWCRRVLGDASHV